MLKLKIKLKRGRQRGQAAVWLVMVTLTLGFFFGLGADTAVLFAEHRRAEQLADSAARAAASAIDVNTLRANPGTAPLLEPAAAELRARAFVTDQHQPGQIDVDPHATPQQVTVRVTLHVVTTLAHAPGASSVEVVAEGSARPRVGLATPAP